MFSIVIPVWNRANVVSKAIESALAQTYDNYEIIIVDDGSDDGLEEVIKPYLSERLFYFRITHSGSSAARNYALKHARGDYIAYLDSDNVWHSEYLSTMWEFLSKEDPPRKAAYCICNTYKFSDATGEMQFEGERGAEFNFRRLLSGNYIDLNTFVHSRDCIDKVGLFDTNLKRLIDWDYIIRITAKFEPLFVPQALVDYFIELADSITAQESYELAYNAIKIKNKSFNRPVTLWHDAIEYRWGDVPDKKYYNWIRMSQGELDTDNFTASGYPYMLQIEPTNFCNLSCPLCPVGRNELGRERKHMTLEEFKSIIDDLGDYLLFLIIWDWGEPFMNPVLPAMIRYASLRGIKTVVSTNGQFFANKSYLIDLLTSGLTTLIVAIDSLYEDNYESYRKKGSLNKALEGLERTIELKDKLGSMTHINMRMVIMKQNEHELDALRARAKSMGVDRFSVKTVNPSCDSHLTDEEVVPENPKYRRYEYQKGSYQRLRVKADCNFIWNFCNVHSNGNIVPCCCDYDGKMNVGNIHTEKISEVWNGPRYRELRRRVTFERSSLARCMDCGVNFKLTATGWFVESLDLSRERLSSDELQRLKSQIQESGRKIEELENEIAEMKKSILWRLLMRYHESVVERALPCNTKRREFYNRGIESLRRI